MTAALLIFLSIVIKPIKVNALAGEAIAAGAITAGSVWGAVAGGVGIGLAVGADAIADGLSNGTIDNRVEQWLWNKASEWEYGYTQSQVDGKIFKAELTYRDLKDLSALLSEAYPDGQITTDRGHIITVGNSADFPVPLPLDTDIYFTDTTQTGETATSLCINLYSSGSNIRIKRVDYELPSGTSLKTLDEVFLMNALADNVTCSLSIISNGYVYADLKVTYPDGDVIDKSYQMSRRFIGSNPTLITYSLPTYVPGVGLAGASSADISDLIDALQDVPFGMSDDDVAVSIPVTGDDTDVGDNTGTETGVDTSEIIENAPDVAVDGSFSNLKLPKTISSVFPFCLPFDFYNGIRLFSAQPVTPHFEIPVKIPIPSAAGGGYLCDETIVIDLSKYEKIGRLCRVTSTCAFLFFLIQLSTKIVKGAGA